MTTIFRIILLIGVLLYLAIILVLMRKGRMSLKYSLIWFLSGVILLICAIFPQVIRFFTQLMGVYSEANAVFFIGFAPDSDWAVIDVDCVRTIRANPDISADTGNSGKTRARIGKEDGADGA